MDCELIEKVSQKNDRLSRSSQVLYNPSTFHLTRDMKILARLFNFFASLKLAVVLLVTLGVTLACGTFIESLHGAKAAKQVIYASAPFGVLLGLLAVNLTFSALDRLPWQKRHIGFLLTHSGILLILAGSWMTQRFAVDGSLALSEGDHGDAVSLDEPLLQVVIPDSDRKTIVPLKTMPFRWEGRKSVRLPEFMDVQADLLAYFPHAQVVEKVKPHPGGMPALEILLFNDVMRTDGWLFAGDPERDRANLGPATIRFDVRTQDGPAASGEQGKGTLVLSLADREIRVPVSEALEREIPVSDTPYTVKITRFLPHAVVEGTQLINRSEEPLNPACEVLIQGGGITEPHTAFARFPDFPTLHGLSESRTGISIRYELQKQTGPSPANELLLWAGPEGKLSYQVKTQNAVGPEQPLELGKEYATGWMDLRFKATRAHAAAAYESVFEARPFPGGGKSPEPAAMMEFRKGADTKRVWFTPGGHQAFYLENTPVHVALGMRSIPLNFQIRLKDFMVDYYPGTNRPASFKSSVVLEDASLGINRGTVISMNEPLSHRGFKIYQSGYRLGEGGPDISIFSVGRDPGIPVKYAGSIVMVAGVLIMFYMKRFSNSKPLYSEGAAG
jgi:hypothetical protein